MMWDLVLVCPSGAQLTQLESAVRAVSAPDSEPLSGKRVAAITWSPVAVGPAGVDVIRVVRRTSPSKAARNALGRVAQRLGPGDEGVRFWQAVVGDDHARQALEQAHVVAALERDAIWTVWRWGRRRRDTHVVLGLTAALHRLQVVGGD